MLDQCTTRRKWTLPLKKRIEIGNFLKNKGILTRNHEDGLLYYSPQWNDEVVAERFKVKPNHVASIRQKVMPGKLKRQRKPYRLQEQIIKNPSSQQSLEMRSLWTRIVRLEIRIKTLEDRRR